jgi:hypothetical protein
LEYFRPVATAPPLGRCVRAARSVRRRVPPDRRAFFADRPFDDAAGRLPVDERGDRRLGVARLAPDFLAPFFRADRLDFFMAFGMDILLWIYASLLQNTHHRGYDTERRRQAAD